MDKEIEKTRNCLSRESAKLRGLRGNVGYVGAVKFLRGSHGLCGSKFFFYVSQYFTWVIIIFTWVA